MRLKKLYRKHFSKVPLYDRILWGNYLKVLGIISSMASIISFFISAKDLEVEVRPLASGFCILIAGVFLYMWWNANHTKQAELRINQTRICIEIGDIFSPKDASAINIIAVNDFFDTVADDRIVARKSLHGRLIQRLENQGKMSSLENAISEDTILNSNGTWKEEFRGENKEKVRRYEIGSMLEFESYVLTAFTKFDEKNRAFLSAEEYTSFWMRFWENIDMIYAGRTINIPLIGAGITRFRNGKPSKQELLEIMLWTLKISGFQNTYADSKINFVIYEKDAPEIDFYHIQHNRNFR